MTRFFYRLLLALHPGDFRDRFEDQMLLLVEEAGQELGIAYLLTDAIQSLARQWLLRPSLLKFVLGGLVNAAIVALIALASEDPARPGGRIFVNPPPVEAPKQRVRIYYYAPQPIQKHQRPPG